MKTARQLRKEELEETKQRIADDYVVLPERFDGISDEKLVREYSDRWRNMHAVRTTLVVVTIACALLLLFSALRMRRVPVLILAGVLTAIFAVTTYFVFTLWKPLEKDGLDRELQRRGYHLGDKGEATRIY